MKKINLNQPVFSAAFIQAKIAQYAQKINKQYQAKQLVLIGVLRGGVFFATSLMQALTQNKTLELDFVVCQSYRNTVQTTLRSQSVLQTDLKDKHVLVVDDIWDSGATVKQLIEYFKPFQPASLRFACLIRALFPAPAKTVLTLPAEPVDFLILWQKTHTKQWLVGFGMDIDGHYRQLKAIYAIN